MHVKLILLYDFTVLKTIENLKNSIFLEQLTTAAVIKAGFRSAAKRSAFRK